MTERMYIRTYHKVDSLEGIRRQRHLLRDIPYTWKTHGKSGKISTASVTCEVMEGSGEVGGSKRYVMCCNVVSCVCSWCDAYRRFNYMSLVYLNLILYDTIGCTDSNSWSRVE